MEVTFCRSGALCCSGALWVGSERFGSVRSAVGQSGALWVDPERCAAPEHCVGPVALWVGPERCIGPERCGSAGV